MFNPAYAQSASQQPSMFASFYSINSYFFGFLFLLIRPQQKTKRA